MTNATRTDWIAQAENDGRLPKLPAGVSPEIAAEIAKVRAEAQARARRAVKIPAGVPRALVPEIIERARIADARAAFWERWNQGKQAA